MLNIVWIYFNSQSRYSEHRSTFSNYLMNLSEKISDKMASEKRLQMALLTKFQLLDFEKRN